MHHTGKSETARDGLRRPSTNQIASFTRATLAIHQSHLPDRRNYPAYITHRTRTRTYKNAQHTAAHATIDVRSRHRTNPRSTRSVLDKASECRRRPRSYHVIRCLGGERFPTASYALRPNLNLLFFRLEKRDRVLLSSVFYTPANDTPSISIHNKPTVNPLRVGQDQRI